MAKFTDAVVATLQGYFDINDQPTSAQFDALILAIQEGIEEHNHDATGDGDGMKLDWDEIWTDGVHTHGSAAEGGVDLGPLDSATMADGAWQGIGAALERIVYNTAGSIVIEGANFGVGIGTPVYKCHIWTGNAGADPAWEAAARRGLLLESNDELHLTLFTPTNKTGRLQFADPGGVAEGYLSYNHATDLMTLATGGASRITITVAGVTKIANLAGVGNRNVVAAADGTLSAP